MVSLCLWWRAICDPPANRLNTHTHTRNYTLIEACMCFGWTTAEHARFTMPGSQFMHMFFFFERRMAWNWIEKRRNGCDIVTNSHVLNHSKIQHPNDSTNRLGQSECECISEAGKKNILTANTELKDWCCPVMVFIVSEFGLTKYIFGYIMEIYVCARAHHRPPLGQRTVSLNGRVHTPHVCFVAFVVRHTSESVCVNFKCNWHLCTSMRRIESMHSSAHRERGERVPQTFMCFCPVDISNEMNKLNNSLWHSMCYSTAEYVEYVFHFFFSFVCLACAPVFFSLSSRIIYSMVAAVHLTLFNDAFQFPFNI